MKITDSDIISMAALAADIPGFVDKYLNMVYWTDSKKNYLWLYDDGDAFRLADMLRFRIDIHSSEVWVISQEGITHTRTFHDQDERMSSLRRAIVETAAKVGYRKKLKHG
jgi:hypothetical protein